MAVAALSLGLPGAAASPRPAAQPAAATFDAPPVKWGSCPDGIVLWEDDQGYGTYSCATYTVPLDYGQPAGPTVELTMIRRAAGDPAKKLGTLFVNPGGPGRSGFALVAEDGEQLFDREVLDRYGVVGVDPRGIARSTPLQCFTGFENPYTHFAAWSFPTTDRERATMWRASRLFNRACDANADAALRENMSTTAVVDDFDVLRRAVGDKEFNFVGYAYGSYIAAVYTHRYPQHVGAVVADGILDPIAWSTGDTPREGRRVPLAARLGSDQGAQEAQNEFFRMCDAAGPEVCPFGPNSSARFTALHDQLTERPIVDEYPRFMTDGRSLAREMNRILTSSQDGNWGEWGRLLASLEERAGLGGESNTPDSRSLGVDGGEVKLPEFTDAQEQFLGVLCSDGVRPRSREAWHRADEASPGQVGRERVWWDHQCADWKATDKDHFRGPWGGVTTANPVLVSSMRYDPETPYQGAQKLHELLPGSVLLTVEGWGHLTPLTSACADDITKRYLLREKLTDTAYTCSQDTPPFPSPEEAPEDPPTSDGDSAGGDGAAPFNAVPGTPEDERVAKRKKFEELVGMHPGARS